MSEIDGLLITLRSMRRDLIVQLAAYHRTDGVPDNGLCHLLTGIQGALDAIETWRRDGGDE